MYWKDTAVLVGVALTVDDDGYKTTSETKRTVYADKTSVTRSEFYTAKQAGDKIVLVLKVSGADYGGETIVEYGRKRYEVVRAYTKNGETCVLNCKEAEEPQKMATYGRGKEGSCEHQ